MILLSSVLIGMGSSIFHPEASRVAHMAAGDRHGFAQALFQVGGNLGTSFGPLLAALIIVPNGQRSILWFTLLALAGIILLARVGAWYGGTSPTSGSGRPRRPTAPPTQGWPSP
jgi:FSR family fosmidomycin resistance protein-like MFS transporter